MTPSDAARARYYGLYSDDPLYLRHIKSDPQWFATGPDGECWSNAARLVRAQPHRLAYVEGMAVLDGRREPHGYAMDLSTGLVVEATRNFRWAHDYRGHVLDIAAVDAWYESNPDRVAEAGHRSSIIWALLAQEAEEDRPSRWFSRQLTSLWLRGARRRPWMPEYAGRVSRGTESVGPA